MPTINHQSLLAIATFIFLIFNTLLTCTHASINDENEINKIFKSHGKKNVVSFIFQKRDGRITIQKNKSFLNIKGKPDIALITAKSIIQDLGILKINISDLKAELDIHIEKESKKKDEELNNLSPISDDNDILLSDKLNRQIQIIQSKYNKTDSVSERRKLKKQLSNLKRSYKKAKQKEKPSHNKKRRSESSCNRAKLKLKELTNPDYRHRIFFCNDRNYRNENPKLCDSSKHVRRYTPEEHKDELRRLRLESSKYCQPE